MRPEKAWRPLVTVEIDKHHFHETMLGVDGQNINQKEVFIFHDAAPSSEIEIKIWHRSPSKKKKRKVLVASASHCLGDLLKRQELESKLEIRLQCRTADRNNMSSKGRPQNGAVLHIKIKAPLSALRIHPPVEPEHFKEIQRPREKLPWEDSNSADSTSIDSDSCIIDNEQTPRPPQQVLRHRKKIKRYHINTESEAQSSSSDDDDDGDYLPEKKLLEDSSVTLVDDDDDPYSKRLACEKGSLDRIIRFRQPGEDDWMALSKPPLPLYTERLTVPRELTRGERMLSSFTMYAELSRAETDDHFESVFKRLQHEWTFVGGLLVALAAVNITIFSTAPGAIVNINQYARGAIATSTMATGLGIACDAWFLLRYNWADLETFKARARDLYHLYFFFSISARVPTFCMFISALCLMAFLGLGAFNAWPQGVMLLCFLVGIIMSMQFLVYGAHWCATKVAIGGRAGTREVVKAVRKVTG